MKPEEVQKALDDANPDEREKILHNWIVDNRLTSKMMRPTSGSTPQYVLGIGTSSATIVGTANKAPAGSTIQFVFGPAPGVYSQIGAQIPGDGSLDQPIVGHLSGLASLTTYYFTVQTIDVGGKLIGQSDEKSFTTLGHDIHCISPTDVRITTANISGRANASEIEKIRLVYYSDEEAERKINSSSASLKGLLPATEYRYVVQVIDRFGNVLDESSECHFTTLGYVAECLIEGVTACTSTLNGLVNFVPEEQTIRILYRSDKSKTLIEVGRFQGTNERNQKVISEIKDLSPNKKYWAVSQVLDSEDRILFSSSETPFVTRDFSLSIDIQDIGAAGAKVICNGSPIEIEDSLKVSLDGKEFKIIPGTGNTSVIVTILDLLPSTVYTITLDVVSPGGTVRASVYQKFTTESYNPQAINVLNIQDRRATLIGTADFVPRNHHVRFCWEKTKKSEKALGPLLFGDTTANQSFGYMAFGLEPFTEYLFNLEVLKPDGTVICKSEDLLFTTAETLYSRKKVVPKQYPAKVEK